MNLVLFFVISIIFCTSVEEGHFSLFKSIFKKRYGTNSEEKKAFEAFKDNLKTVEFLNEKYKGKTTFGYTKFMDMSQQEFQSKVLHQVPKEKLRKGKRVVKTIKKILDTPKYWDWEENGAVTTVKDQGSCGSCWSFSAVGNIEGVWQRAGNPLMDLSTQQVIDCDSLSKGCDGGWMDNAYSYVINTGGIEKEEDYKYEQKQGKCRVNRKLFVANISNAIDMFLDEELIRDYLYDNNPLSAAMNANFLQFYKEGILDPEDCTSEILNHGVLLVGYGTSNGMPYWRVKNSWGTSWGEKGYFRISRGKDQCGIAEAVASSIIEN